MQAETLSGLRHKSGSVLWHQDLRPDRSIFWARRNRQIYCSWISTNSRASNGAVQLEYPEGSLIQQGQDALPMLRTILGVVAAIAGLTQTRHFEAVPGVHPTSRAIARNATPVLANSTIRARSRIRASAFRDPASASRTWRSSGVKATVVAAGMIFIPPTNHDSRFSDGGY
jgi:hypothetical protein